jgi:DNA-binding transcriptional MerR regulator
VRNREVEHQAFTAERARSLTGLTPRQLQYWDESGLLHPSYTARKGRGRKRLYSFPDLVSLQVIADLRRAGISLQQIRRVVEHLRTLDHERPLAQITYTVENGEMYFQEAGTSRSGRTPHQVVAQYVVPVGAIAEGLRGRIVEVGERRHGEIEQRRGTLGGKPVIKGTRIKVESIWRLHRSGLDEAGIRELYPDLTAADIEAALAVEPPRRPRRRAS